MYRSLCKTVAVALIALFLQSAPAQAFGTGGGPLIIVAALCDITSQVFSSTSGGQTTYTGNIEAINPIDNAITVPVGTFSAVSQPQAELNMEFFARRMCVDDATLFQVSCGAVRYKATGALKFVARVDCR